MKKILKDECSSPKNRARNEIGQDLELSNLKSETKTKDNYSQKFI